MLRGLPIPPIRLPLKTEEEIARDVPRIVIPSHAPSSAVATISFEDAVVG